MMFIGSHFCILHDYQACQETPSYGGLAADKAASSLSLA
jgi:hypothetical protein